MQKIPMFLLISLIRYLARKGVVDMNDFVDSSLRFLDEGEIQLTTDEKRELMARIISLPRSADDPQKLD